MKLYRFLSLSISSFRSQKVSGNEFYHNHRRYKSGKRQGKAPIELLTGKALEADWVALLIQHTQAASQAPSLISSAPLALVPHHHEHTSPSQTPPGEAILEPSTEAALS